MLSYENNPEDPLKSNGKCTVQHISSESNNITGDNNSLPEAEHQLLISSSVAVPNFSIRDFVFSARNKDIGTSWPFPDKHLKLCLKHGVKELLPPFESKICDRKPYSTICLDTNSLVEDGIITRIRNEEHSERVDNLTVHSLADVGLTQKAAAHHLDISFEKRDRDGDFIASDTSNSKMYPSRAVGTFRHRRLLKTSAKTSSNKCKLVVKFGSPSVYSSNEERMPHKNNISDSPASNICPVCKTFSSSSNTTLNAHIDQCLSMETNSEGMTNSRTDTKCKVKSRKMRSMVDIYATAPECTVEDLGRRNGSNWATDLSSPAHNTGASTQRIKKKISSPTEPDREHKDDDGVYIDANGRKLRILSKMDSFSSVVTTKEDNGSRKPQLKKALSSSKKKHHGTKHDKYLKLAVSNEKRLALKTDSSQVLRTDKPSADSMLHKEFRDLDEVDTFRDQGSCHFARHQMHGIQRSTQNSCLDDFNVENSSFQNSYGDLACLSERHKKVKSLDGTHLCTKHSLGVKRTRRAISKDDKNYNMNTTVHKWLKKSNEKPLNQLTRPYKVMNENGLSTATASAKHVHRFLQKSHKLHWHDNSSVSEQLAHDIWKGTLCTTNEADQVQIEVEEDDVDSDENVAAWQSESHLIHDTGHTPNQPSTAEGITTESEKDLRGASHILEDGAVDTCDENVDDHSMPLSGSKVVKRGRIEIQTDTHKNSTTEGIMRRYIRSMKPDNHAKDDSYEYQSSPRASNDFSAVPNCVLSPRVPVFDGGVTNSCNMELGTKARQGDPCSDFDPIPIPGPPGSFLPSPGNAETVDYQANSSLTGSLSSSHNDQDGGNSSKSSTSSASNLAAETNEKVAKKLLSTGTHANLDSPLLGFPVPSSEVSMVETSLLLEAIKFRRGYGYQKSYMKLQDETQPCCCSRKERVQRGSVVDFQESQLLSRRTISATFHPTKENISCSLNTAPSYSSAGTGIYSLSSSSLKAPATPKYPDTVNANKFHANRDLESASPSAVLRLMGKNLMVAKSDEDLSGPSRGDTASPCKPQTQFQKEVPPDPATNTPSYSSNVRYTFDLGMREGGPWGEMNFPRPVTINHLQAGVFDHKWPVQHLTSNNGLDMMHDHMLRGPASSIEFRKTGSEVGVCRNGATVTNSLNYSRASSAAVYTPALSSTPAYMQQVAGNTCFPVPFSSSGRSLDHLQLSNNYSQNGSYVIHGVGGGGPFMASSLSSSTHPKSGQF